MSEVVYPLEGKRIWVAGHKGMVGSALVRRLASENCEAITVDRQDVDLIRQAEVEAWLDNAGPDASRANERRWPCGARAAAGVRETGKRHSTQWANSRR